MRLDTPLRDAVGGRTAGALATHLDLHTVGDLVHHYPRRYAERGELTPFDALVVGEHVTVLAEVRRVDRVQVKPRLWRFTLTLVDSAGATLEATVWNRHHIPGQLPPGRQAFFSGKVGVFAGRRKLDDLDVQLLDDRGEAAAADYAGTLVAIYPATAKVSSWVVRSAVGLVLAGLEVGADPLPPELRDAHGLPGLLAALRGIHLPATRAEAARARTRLTWDEALVLQVVLAQRRAAVRATAGTPRVPRPGGLLAAFDERLPFELTAGQREVGQVLLAELAGSAPMNRLLQGEVGSGKTVVALRAMLAVVDAGGQAALLAPTEVLAQQHARSLRELLGPLARGGQLEAADRATQVALLTGSLGQAARRRALLSAASGEAGIVVGTHALLSEGVEFADLGLVVVDEQHRFGVEQRDALRAKGVLPHVLVMTATPIPRTVAMTVYGDLEVSTLTELPAGRAGVRTAVVPVAERPAWLDTAWQRVREAVSRGEQAFVVCPRIGDEGRDEPPDPEGRRPAAAVQELEPLLAAGPLAGLRTAQLHGRLAPDAREEVMRRVVQGEVQVLVATTVIEVGVDVPAATVMVVMDAERFGLSQLHQLRGRVGRGTAPAPALCLLVTEAEGGTPARTRLEAVAATSDGFELARLDLEARREGDVLGGRQSGRRSSLRLLQLLRDADLIGEARAAAVELVAADPDLSRHPALAAAAARLVDEEQAEFLEKV